MMILSRVCAQFHNVKGETVFTVTPALRNLFTEAPEEIREDPLFRLLILDGSLEAAVTEKRKKLLENDPAQGTDASGKKAEAEKPEIPVRKGRGKAAPDAVVPAAEAPAAENGEAK